MCENFYGKPWLRSPNNVFPNNNKTKQKSGRSSGKKTKQQTRDVVLSMYAPHRIPCPTHPTEVQNTVRVVKAIQFNLSMAASTKPVPVTVADLMTAVPGGNTYWSRVRVNLIRLWAPTFANQASTGDSPTLRVVSGDDGLNEPPVSWSDNGTGGQQRPRIAFALGLREQAAWHGVASNQLLCTVAWTNSAGGTPFVIVQASVELLSPSP
jgi:hypothetical protein